MIKRILAFSVVGVLSIGKASAYPSSMDIGTFTIDDYSGNGGGLGDLSFMIASGQSFFLTASAAIPAYSLLGGPGNETMDPRQPLALSNTDVTQAAITNPDSAYGTRGFCDFLYYGGHGLGGRMYLGAGSDYGSVTPSSLNLGSGYNRWLLANSCSLFSGGTPATVWNPAFRGLKAMLGFKSLVFETDQGWELYADFWNRWTYGEESLLSAFFNSEADYGYQQLHPSQGLEPGCLSAKVSGRPDYCREAFKSVDHDYNPAPAKAGNYYYRVIGKPQY